MTDRAVGLRKDSQRSRLAIKRFGCDLGMEEPMRPGSIHMSGTVLSLAVGLAVFSTGDAWAASCVGSCGTASAADGTVSLPPGGGNYRWISTFGGQAGVGQMSGVYNGPSPDGMPGPS
jgi:hypothetical protein